MVSPSKAAPVETGGEGTGPATPNSPISTSEVTCGEQPRERDLLERRTREAGAIIFRLAEPPVEFLAVCLVLAIEGVL